MLQKIFAQGRSSAPQEGTLYKIANVRGQTFELYYGYYDEKERSNPMIEPMPIYPDFLREPQYASDGCAFVTQMQDICQYYIGEGGQMEDRCCADCDYYCHGDELLGVCMCPQRRRTPESQEKQKD